LADFPKLTKWKKKAKEPGENFATQIKAIIGATSYNLALNTLSALALFLCCD
jgi:hypothetical protein